MLSSNSRTALSYSSSDDSPPTFGCLAVHVKMCISQHANPTWFCSRFFRSTINEHSKQLI
ncbi:hypothetical protein FH972_003567 [Carpinus fangiana]|uniref:Uncharacterized protein n=1 Tax=Carpinus fangiana TaxID=176857 RepID=A0A5N6QIV1_9ROSI|nr:hypothetical protein FH972_003567 [Carpinus fangiana]